MCLSAESGCPQRATGGRLVSLFASCSCCCWAFLTWLVSSAISLSFSLSRYSLRLTLSLQRSASRSLRTTMMTTTTAARQYWISLRELIVADAPARGSWLQSHSGIAYVCVCECVVYLCDTSVYWGKNAGTVNLLQRRNRTRSPIADRRSLKSAFQWRVIVCVRVCVCQ